MKIDWKMALAAGLGVFLLFVIVKAAIGYAPESVAKHVPSVFKS